MPYAMAASQSGPKLRGAVRSGGCSRAWASGSTTWSVLRAAVSGAGVADGPWQRGREDRQGERRRFGGGGLARARRS